MKHIRIAIGEGVDISLVAAQYESFLRATQTSYTLKRTKSTIDVIPDISSGFDARKYIQKGIDPKSLGFIRRVKNHVEKFPLPERIRPLGQSVNYNGAIKGLDTGIFTDFVEIDVSAAYWRKAHQLGYLSEDLFKEGENTDIIPKETRLISLGALAKKTEITEYNAPEYDGTTKVQVAETAVIWDNITFSFGLDLAKVCDAFRDDIAGWWVDAVFVRKRSAAEVRRMFEICGYPVKLVTLDKLEIKEDRVGVYDIIRTIKGEVKPLPPFDTNVKRVGLNAAREGLIAEFLKNFT